MCPLWEFLVVVGLLLKCVLELISLLILLLAWFGCSVTLFSMLVFGISKVLLLGVNRLYLPFLFVVPYSFDNWIFFVHVG